jgi:hypothetical protein
MTWRSFAALVIVLLPWTAAALGIFVGGDGFADIVRCSHFASESPTIVDDDLSGRTKGWLVGAGGTLARHALVQLEVAGTGTLHKDFEPPRVLPPQPPLPFVAHRSADYRTRTRHVAVLGGYTTGVARRVSASALVGLMFVQERTHTVSTLVPRPPGPGGLPSDSTSTIYRTTPAFGFDLPIRVAPHVALLPQVRLYKLSFGPLAIWPGASARIDF